MKEKILNMSRIVILSVILSSAIGYSLADWVAPSGPPPLGNTPPPINVGGASQVKEGNLFINNLLWAKKARSVSTTAADPDDTLVTKDYVDGKGGDMKWITGVGCATCPYGSYIIRWNSGARERACFFKDKDGTLFKPGENDLLARKANAMCYLNYYDFSGPGLEPTFLFWTY